MVFLLSVFNLPIDTIDGLAAIRASALLQPVDYFIVIPLYYRIAAPGTIAVSGIGQMQIAQIDMVQMLPGQVIGLQHPSDRCCRLIQIIGREIPA